MLVLSRKEGEAICIPQIQLTLRVVRISSGRVRLGVSAPPNIRVNRAEVHSLDEAGHVDVTEKAAMPVRVLLTDSDSVLLEQYASHLRRSGFDVVTANHGLECVQSLRTFRPDVLVLEPRVLWGGGSGILDVLEDDSTLPSVKVIILTDGRDRSSIYDISPYAIADFRVKPLSARRLAERINAVLGFPCDTYARRAAEGPSHSAGERSSPAVNHRST